MTGIMLHMGDTLDEEDVFVIFYELKNKTRLCYSRSRGDDFSLKISLSTSSRRISRPRDLSRGRETRTRVRSRSHISSSLIGSLSNDDINSNNSAKNKETIGRMRKNNRAAHAARTEIHFFDPVCKMAT